MKKKPAEERELQAGCRGRKIAPPLLTANRERGGPEKRAGQTEGGNGGENEKAR